MANRVWPVLAVAVVFCLSGAWYYGQTPSADRDWREDQSRQGWVSVDGDHITVHDVRDATYRTTEDYDVQWVEKSYRLSSLEKVYFIVEPIGEWDGMAHTFYSFKFGDEYLAVSVEARKEVGESYGLLAGVARQFELIYVFATEQDAVGLRANNREHDVYLYPINTTPERARLLFLDVAARATKLRSKPEFYNTFTSSCTTSVAEHANAIVPGRIPMWSVGVMFPGYSDTLAYELHLIDTDAPLEEIRVRYNISDQARSWDGTTDFSDWIRREEI